MKVRRVSGVETLSLRHPDLGSFAMPRGIIKAALGFRQFLLRGLEQVRGEWSLVTMAWNIKRMFVLDPAK